MRLDWQPANNRVELLNKSQLEAARTLQGLGRSYVGECFLSVQAFSQRRLTPLNSPSGGYPNEASTSSSPNPKCKSDQSWGTGRSDEDSEDIQGHGTHNCQSQSQQLE